MFGEGAGAFSSIVSDFRRTARACDDFCFQSQIYVDRAFQQKVFLVFYL